MIFSFFSVNCFQFINVVVKELLKDFKPLRGRMFVSLTIYLLKKKAKLPSQFTNKMPKNQKKWVSFEKDLSMLSQF